MRTGIWRTVFVLGVALGAAASATAQVPRTISYQGILADAAGNLLPDGNHTLTLTLYDALSNGAQVFTETQSAVVVRGTFNVLLGATSGGVPTSVSFDRAYFLGVKVDGGTELTPRVPLTAAPYALRAAVADSANAVAPNAITAAGLATGAVTPAKIDAAGATSGQVLTFNGATTVFADPTLKAPFSLAGSMPGALFSLANSGSGAAAFLSSTLASSDAKGLEIETPAGVNGTALRVRNGRLAWSYEDYYSTPDPIDDGTVILRFGGSFSLPTTGIVDGMTVWVVNASSPGTPVTIHGSAAAGLVAIDPGYARQFLYIDALTPNKWVPVQ